MTNPVTAKDSLALSLSRQVTAGQNSGKQGDSFSAIMDKTTNNEVKRDQKYEKNENSNVGKTKVDSAGKKVSSEKTDRLTEKKETDLISDGTEQAVQDAAKKVLEEVAKSLGMSVEEVEGMLKQMGMVPTDLLQLGNLAQVLSTLAGDGDMTSILTDEKLYGMLKDLTQFVQETVNGLKEALSLTDDGMQKLLAQMKQNVKAEDGMEELQQNLDLNASVEPEEGEKHSQNEDNEVTTVKNQGTLKETQNTVHLNSQDQQQVKETPTAAKLAGQQTQAEQGNTVDVSVEGQAQNAQGQNLQQEAGQSEEKPEDGSGNTFQNLQLKNAQNQTIVNEVPVVRNVPDTEGIMRQIVDYMKVHVKADLTQMEIQLHPQSLGNINIQIASREGVISAQITAQNESVKAVIESQVMQLKENLNEQGLKVEAVEVTVASHQFERSMDQKNRQDTTGEESKKKSPRKINLDSLEEIGQEELEESDKIAVDMMHKSGNTFDYTA